MMRSFVNQVGLKGAGFFVNVAIILVLGFLLSSPCLAPGRTDIAKLLAAALLSAGLVYLLFRAGPKLNWTVCLTSLIALAAIESVFRLASHDPSSGQDPVRVPRPYVVFGGKPDARFPDKAPMTAPGEQAEPIHLNHLGFRFEKSLPLAKPEGQKRVFVLGGSTVFNGNPESKTIPSLLEQRFHQDGFTHVQVYNFGSVSFVSGQELALLTHTLLDYRPDVVIVYDGGNDMMSPFFYDPRPDHPYNYRVFEQAYEQLSGRPQESVSFLASLLLHSRAVRVLFGRDLQNLIVSFRQLRERQDYGSDAWEQLVVDRYIANIRKMAGMAKGFDFRFIAILQPLVHFKNPRMGREESLLGSEEFQGYLVGQYSRAREHLADLRNEESFQTSCLFLDLSGIMNGHNEETYWDFIHTDNRGNEYIAGQIYSRIRDWVTKQTSGGGMTAVGRAGDETTDQLQSPGGQFHLDEDTCAPASGSSNSPITSRVKISRAPVR